MPVRILLATLLCLGLTAGCRDEAAAPAADVANSIARLNEAGTIMAANTVGVNGPGWGGSQRITWIIAEGTRVAKGDTLVRFDTNDIDGYLQQYNDELTAKRLAVVSSRAQGTANRTRSENGIDKAELASEMAALELENQQYEAETVRAKAELAGRQATIDLEQAHRSRLAQASLDSLNIAQASLQATKQEARVERMITYLDQLTAIAQAPGMVVYFREYTDEGIKVYRAGDEVRRQGRVLDITDTSVMKVTFAVHEKDRWRLQDGQNVQVILDAYTDTVFDGVVENVGRMPVATEEGSVARRFEATAIIHDTDSRLKPGMSARVIIELGGSS